MRKSYFFYFHRYQLSYLDPILEQIKLRTITIIVESHKKPESNEFFQSLVSEKIKNYEYIVIGLEIGSDQQASIDKVSRVGHRLMK
jgi:hypothetical protein